MHIKIYFENKPLFLCDDIDEEIAPYVHHDDAIFVDEFSTPAINSMIHEMRTPRIHAGILYHTSIDDLKKAVFKKFTVIMAAGGVVMNHRKQVLMIFRKGKWDMPKGKLDDHEALEICAVREVKEETGLKNVKLSESLLTTYHTYDEAGKHILKESHWFLMQGDAGDKLVPQTEEDITEIKWVAKEGIDTCLQNSFPLIRDILSEIGFVSKGKA